MWRYGPEAIRRGKNSIQGHFPGNGPENSVLSAETLGDVLDEQLGQAIPAAFVEVFIVSVTFAKHLEILEIPASHLVDVIAKGLDDLVLFNFCHTPLSLSTQL